MYPQLIELGAAHRDDLRRIARRERLAVTARRLKKGR